MSDSLWRRSRRIWRRTVQDDVDDEVRFHVQMRVEQFMAGGMSRSDAERAAQEQFGDEAQVRSTLIDIGEQGRRRQDWRERFDSLRQDIVVSLRSLGREPLFTAGVIATLALGIGANATMFGVIDRLMLRGPEHVVDARRVDRLYLTTNAGASGVRTESFVGWVTYATLRDRATSFAGVAAYSTNEIALLTTGNQKREIPAARATWDLFPMLGVKPVMGRFYDVTEDRPPRGEQVVVIGEDFWQSEFGGDTHIVGRRITLGDSPYTVVGVAPNGFTGPERVRADVWFPMSLTNPTPDWPTTYRAQWLRVVARLKPGVTTERAGAEATRVLRAAYDGDRPAMRQLVASLRPLWYGGGGAAPPVVSVSRWLMGVAVVVLLITCANVANLFVARTRRRRREIAVRLALGVGRLRLVRLLLTETMLVVFAGAFAAVMVAWMGGGLMRATLLSNVAWSAGAIDQRVFGFTLIVAVAVGLLVGLAPALEATRVNLTGSLKTGDREGGGRRGTGRAALSMVQAALSVVLLIGAGLFVQSLSRVRSVNLGFQPARVIRAQPRFAPSATEGKDARAVRAQGYQDALYRLQTLPWVEHAAISIGSPYGNGFTIDVTIPGRDSLMLVNGERAKVSAVSGDYFATLGMAVRRGRSFTSSDHSGTSLVAIVGETMAKAVWPGEDPIGKCLIIGDAKPRVKLVDGHVVTQPAASPPTCSSVVGVVGDVHRGSVREPATMQYYIPLGQEVGFGGSELVVRPRGSVADGMLALQHAMAAMPEFSYTRIATIQTAIDPEFRPWQLGAAMFGVFGVLALVIASVGLYSVIAYLVADRTRELGVRLALGATSGRIVREVVSRGVATTAGGVVVGVAIAIVAGRFVQPLLFDVSARSPVIFGAVAALVIGIGVVASWAPARRASRVDPVI
ncbi:MAG TPA: ADOP family duplicated permease, partial [Gemmatimonadaceae bacterium]|nr:ADOP family duplicated permease [Gemmatimonadaceae bacterium]